ncbi:MAG: histidinol dehydrogenase [Candidatus Eremiobacteraeota bacterium]|nr:histidinol dehydrogenase [Candidatus Eremiobacteraeota bacterium]NNM93523.1 histidinol dehydrogenase [Candidatus Eremiobacteraeota bacterium]
MRFVRADDPIGMAAVLRRGWRPDPGIVARVAAILTDVESRGDRAILEYSQRFDAPEYRLTHLRVPIPMPTVARGAMQEEVAAAIERARDRIVDFHRRQRAEDIAYRSDDGTEYAFRREPLGSVAVYAPGGSAALPSSVLMGALPAKLAGVRRTIVLTPPQGDGRVHPAVLFAASLCEVDELYAVGGAQAIAAAAFGTASIAAVDKIVGPGNSYVTEAKRQVFGMVGIDGLAGPSEVLVVADAAASSELVVSELLAQAEHDAEARVAVVSDSFELLESCAQLLQALDVARLPRGATIAAALERGGFFIEARSKGEIAATIAAFAPEHLSLQVAEPEFYLSHLRCVGAVFVGSATPVACGDYLAGTNHVLPTSGSARFASGLSLADFTRSYSVVRNSSERMHGDAAAIAAFASFEGLDAHAQSARLRMKP